MPSSLEKPKSESSKSEAPKQEAKAQKIMSDRVEQLRKRRERILLGGGQERIDKQHAAGKLTARERIAKLVDRDSFQEVGLFAQHRATTFGMADKDMPADGVVTGCATLDGRLVHLASQDFTVAGGASA